MNPVTREVKEQRSIPLPDLLDAVSLDRTKVVQVVERHESLKLKAKITEKQNLAYHEVLFIE